jgi:hypothetical protein
MGRSRTAGPFKSAQRQKGDQQMRVMVFVKENEESETGALPDTAIIAKMNQYNEDLVKAGVLLAAEGLRPSSQGKRVRFDGEKRTVIDGPFAEAKELIAGYWLWQVRDMDEAVEWLKRAPFDQTELEIRPIFESEEFGEQLTPELRAQEQRIRDQVAARNS